MSAKTASEERALVQTFEELEAHIVRAHDTYSPGDPTIDLHLGLALMHVRKARGSRVLPPNPYPKKK